MLTESIRRMSCSHSRCFLQSSVSQVTSSNSITPWTTLLVRSVRPRLLRSWSAADKQPRLEPGWVLTTKFVLSCSSGYKSPASYNADGLKQRLTESWSGLWQNDMTLLLASKQKKCSRTWATFRTFTVELHRAVWEKFHFSVDKMCLFMYVWQHELTMSDAKMCQIYIL